MNADSATSGGPSDPLAISAWIESNHPRLSGARVANLQIITALNRPTSALVDLRLPGASVEAADLLGHRVTLHLIGPPGQRSLTLEVDRVDTHGWRDGAYSVDIHLKSALARLSRDRRRCLYRSKPFRDLVGKVLARAGIALKQVSFELSSEPPIAEMLVQREDSLKFLVAFLAERGAAICEIDAGEGTRWVIFDRASGRPALLEHPLAERGPGGDVLGDVHARTVRRAHRLPLRQASATGWDVCSAAHVDQADAFSSDEKAAGYLEVARAPVDRGPIDEVLCRRPRNPIPSIARAELRAGARGATRLDLRTNALGVCAGGTLQLESDGVDDGAWLILFVTEKFSAPDVDRDGRVTQARYSAHVKGAVAREWYPKPRVRPPPRQFDTATVASRPDGPGWTDFLGRLAVTLHWGHDRAEDTTCLASVATAFAGPGFGLHLGLRPGSSVIVAWLDADTPVIVGAMWTTETVPPPSLPAEVAHSVVLHTARLGHEHEGLRVCVSDEGDAPFVHTDTPGDLVTRIGRARTVGIRGDDGLTVGGDATCTVGGVCRISAAAHLLLSADDHLVLRGARGASIAFTPDGEIHIQGTKVFIQSGLPELPR